MSVDTLRENFHINRISVKDLQDFLTAQTYRPEITDVKHKILALNHVSLQSVCSKPIRQGKSPKYTENTGLICIKPRNTNDMLVSAEEVDWIEPSTKAEIQNQKLVYGDVVITRSGSGTIGRASVYPYAEEAYVNDHLFIVRPSSADSHYVCSYLKSYFGERLLESGISGSTGQLNLSNEHIKAVPLFFPKPDAQKYIGDKVRQAERLRAWAKELVNRADSTISSQFEFSLVPSMRSQPRSISSELLSPVSLGPEFARASEGQATFSDSMKLEEYIDSCKCGDPIKSEDRVDGKYSYYGASGPIDKHNDYNFDGEYLIVAQDGSIGCANIARGKFWANNHVWVVKLNAAYDIDSVCRYLDEHFPYWKGVTTGSVVPKVTSENLLNVQVPIAIAKNEYIGDLLRLSSNATSLSSTLVNTAKLLVEDLIEGQVSEAELVSAQQALEAGDESLDRALLERMTAEGVDGEGDPLFDDIDQLYDLLEQAKKALDADDTMAEV